MKIVRIECLREATFSSGMERYYAFAKANNDISSKIELIQLPTSIKYEKDSNENYYIQFETYPEEERKSQILSNIQNAYLFKYGAYKFLKGMNKNCKLKCFAIYIK